MEKIVFDPKKTFIKFNLDEFHFDFLPNLVAFYHKDFKRCYSKKEVGEIDEIRINIISKEDLLLDKQKLGRDQDLADIENLEEFIQKAFQDSRTHSPFPLPSLLSKMSKECSYLPCNKVST